MVTVEVTGGSWNFRGSSQWKALTLPEYAHIIPDVWCCEFIEKPTACIFVKHLFVWGKSRIPLGQAGAMNRGTAADSGASVLIAECGSGWGLAGILHFYGRAFESPDSALRDWAFCIPWRLAQQESEYNNDKINGRRYPLSRRGAAPCLCLKSWKVVAWEHSKARSGGWQRSFPKVGWNFGCGIQNLLEVVKSSIPRQDQELTEMMQGVDDYLSAGLYGFKDQCVPTWGFLGIIIFY